MEPYKVKIITRRDDDKMFVQLPGAKPFSFDGKYRFYINEHVENPDFVVVHNKYLKDERTFNVAPENTILLLSEPYSVLNYPPCYRNQFGLLCSCQDHLKHKNIHYRWAALPWYVGVNQKRTETLNPDVTYDKLTDAPLPEKTKLISVITSNKIISKGHQDRIDFVMKLKEHYGDKIDLFGRGFNTFDDKWDVLAPYKYHISIENSQNLYYFTEKLTDTFLAGTFPIYYGCKNIEDYFDSESLEKIDIHDFEGAVKIIDRILEQDLFSKRQQALIDARKKVLRDYNFFELIAKLCDTLNPDAPKKTVKLRRPHTDINIVNFYRHTIQWNVFKIKRKFFKKKS